MSVKKIKVKQEGDAGKVVKKPKRESDVGGVDKVVKKKPKLEAVEMKKVSKLTSMPAKALKVDEPFSRFDLECGSSCLSQTTVVHFPNPTKLNLEGWAGNE